MTRYMTCLFGLCLVLLSPAIADAKDIYPPSEATRTSLAFTFCNEKLALWQNRLALQDWKVKINIVRKQELEPDTVGEIDWDRTTKSAVIRLLDPVDYQLPLPAILHDLEDSVVHELIHLRLLLPYHNEADEAAEEEATAYLTDALLKLERSRQ
jgi:hypothetical protein